MVDLKCLSSLTVHSNNKQFRNLTVTCDKKWILYNWWRPAQLVDRGAASKHFPKPNLHQKKVMVAVWQSAASMIHYSFLNSGETMTSEKYTQQIGEIFWKLLYLQPTVVNRKGPIFSTTKPNCMLHNQRFKSWMNWATKFCPLRHIHPTSCQPTTILHASRQFFCRENTSTTRSRQKMLSKSSSNPEAWIFTPQE